MSDSQNHYQKIKYIYIYIHYILYILIYTHTHTLYTGKDKTIGTENTVVDRGWEKVIDYN